jgi:hypothetical protein
MPQLIIIHAINALEKTVMNVGITLCNKLPSNIMEMGKNKTV